MFCPSPPIECLATTIAVAEPTAVIYHGSEGGRRGQADRSQPEAAFRLAQAWMAEAHALHKEGSPNAQVMWQNAAAQCELAFDQEPTNPRVAIAAASCHHFAGDDEAAEAWMEIGQHLASGGTAAADGE